MKRLPLLETALGILAPVPAMLVAVAVLFPAPAVAEPGKAKLTVTVTNITEHKGVLQVAVYDAAGYDADKVAAADSVAVTAGTATATFDLPAGQYGIKMFHDVNGDGKMGTNPFGMPTEPFAFSNNAPAQFGPATWDAAKFDVPAGGATQTIKLQ
jgi:uncharacterized protein (DUF2141 family)